MLNCVFFSNREKHLKDVKNNDRHKPRKTLSNILAGVRALTRDMIDKMKDHEEEKDRRSDVPSSRNPERNAQTNPNIHCTKLIQ